MRRMAGEEVPEIMASMLSAPGAGDLGGILVSGANSRGRVHAPAEIPNKRRSASGKPSDRR